jgi:hypothetical protein
MEEESEHSSDSEGEEKIEIEGDLVEGEEKRKGGYVIYGDMPKKERK